MPAIRKKERQCARSNTAKVRRCCIYFLVGSLLIILTGCHSIQFYHQAIVGQTKLLMQREDTGNLRTHAEPTLRARLKLADGILIFAEHAGLSVGGSYTSYVATGESYIIWNVFAAKPYALKLKTFCFPIAGCVSYRGYFDEKVARRYADHLVEEGYEVYVGGVVAYSTLGWFDDPLLDTFLFRSDEQLAALLFHELAHQLVYVPGDTRFNESVATAVEQHMLKKWLLASDRQGSFDEYLAGLQRRQSVLELIGTTREQLSVLYQSGVSKQKMEQRKRTIIARMVEDYSTLQATWPIGAEFHDWMNSEINNAKLETVADYNQWVPVFAAILKGGGLVRFKQEVKTFASMSSAERGARLENILEQQITNRGDNDNPRHVQD